ncbi:MAG: chorismate synthase [Firmicutes bacterium]|nr:chorismate synthase [Bacillota bacterium]
MMNTFGEQLKLSIFGESHGNGIGMVIDGLPPGLAVDETFIAAEMARRAPGNSSLSTPRKEADQVELLSGVFNGFTTGAPICGMIRNTNTRSKDYTPELPRPGHADLTAHLKYNGFADYRGGGHFSGRLTAPLVFAGALCKSLLANNSISVEAAITAIGGVTGHGLTESMEDVILKAKEEGDSVGGIIECVASNLPAGLGSPFFGSVESRLASMLYSIPAVKGVEFGDGFALANMRGSEANDAIIRSGPNYRTQTNHNGGINGGITNGMDVVFRVAIKPTPSISKPQETVNLLTGESATLQVHGRHDPCIVPRAVCVVEAAAAIVFADLLLCQWSDGVRKDR